MAPGNGAVQRDAAAGRGDDLRDSAAHLAGTNDEHVLKTHGGGGYRQRHGDRTPSRCD